MKNYVIFFVAYPWEAHNQVELVIGAAMKDDAETKKIGIYCDGGTKDIRKSCEIIINCEEEMEKEICKKCNILCISKLVTL